MRIWLVAVLVLLGVTFGHSSDETSLAPKAETTAASGPESKPEDAATAETSGAEKGDKPTAEGGSDKDGGSKTAPEPENKGAAPEATKGSPENGGSTIAATLSTFMTLLTHFLAF